MSSLGIWKKACREGRCQMSFVRPLPIYGFWCKDFEEAIKFIFYQEMTTAESPDLANEILHYFLFLQGKRFWMGSKNYILMRFSWNRNGLSQV